MRLHAKEELKETIKQENVSLNVRKEPSLVRKPWNVNQSARKKVHNGITKQKNVRLHAEKELKGTIKLENASETVRKEPSLVRTP